MEKDTDMLKEILRFILITFAIGFSGFLIFIANIDSYNDGAIFFGLLLFFLSPIITGIWFCYKFRKKLNEKFFGHTEQDYRMNQQNILKLRFQEKRRLIDGTAKYGADLTRDLKKKTNEHRQDEIFKEFFAGIDLDITVIKFSEAKEITLEELKINKKK